MMKKASIWLFILLLGCNSPKPFKGCKEFKNEPIVYILCFDNDIESRVKDNKILWTLPHGGDSYYAVTHTNTFTDTVYTFFREEVYLNVLVHEVSHVSQAYSLGGEVEATVNGNFSDEMIVFIKNLNIPIKLISNQERLW
jgi:hypothetical protein